MISFGGYDFAIIIVQIFKWFLLEQLQVSILNLN